MKNTCSRSLHVVVVDECPGDYTNFRPLVQSGEIELQFVTSGGDALRLSHRWLIHLWLINTQLPDLSGFDVVEMLQPMPPGTAVFLIGNQYGSEDELRALRLGVSKFLVKPLSCEWLSDFRLRAPPGRPTIRAGYPRADARAPDVRVPDVRASSTRKRETER